MHNRKMVQKEMKKIIINNELLVILFEIASRKKQIEVEEIRKHVSVRIWSKFPVAAFSSEMLLCVYTSILENGLSGIFNMSQDMILEYGVLASLFSFGALTFANEYEKKHNAVKEAEIQAINWLKEQFMFFKNQNNCDECKTGKNVEFDVKKRCQNILDYSDDIYKNAYKLSLGGVKKFLLSDVYKK